MPSTDNIRRGDIRNSDYAHKAKEYSWAIVSKAFSRNISPTDIDGTIESNSHFIFFELKTEGAEMPCGQRIYFERLLSKLKGRSCLVILEHQRLELVKVQKDATWLQVWFWDAISIGIIKTKRTQCNPGDMIWIARQWQLYADDKSRIFDDWIRGLVACKKQS